MSISRIAIRYAKPLFELAEEKNVLETVKTDMQSFVALCASTPDFLQMLKSPIISHNKKADILKKIFDGKVDGLVSTFFEIITRKSREKYLLEIAREFVVLYNDKKGFQEATVTTTVTLDADMKKAFQQLVTDITGKKPLLTEKIDSSLLGGYLLQLDDQQIDESILGHLNDLKLKFQKETI